MAKIYHVLACDEKGDVLGMPDDPIEDEPFAIEQIERLGSGVPILSNWKPPTAEFFQDEGDTQLDFYSFDSFIATTKRAFGLLCEIEFLEQLPLASVLGLPEYCESGEPWAYLVHCTNRVVLQDGSVFRTFDGTDTVQDMDKACIAKDRIAGATLFKFAQNPVMHYCTEEFKLLVDENALTGISFEEIDFELELR